MRISFLVLFIIFLIAACSSSESFLELPQNKMLIATGNEPGWILQITKDKQIYIVTNYGKDSISLNGNKDELKYLKYTNEKVNGERLLFPDDEVTIDIKHTLCADNMDGSESAETVILTVAKDTFIGCGSFINL